MDLHRCLYFAPGVGFGTAVDPTSRVIQKSMDGTGRHTEIKTSHLQSRAPSDAARVDIGKPSF